MKTTDPIFAKRTLTAPPAGIAGDLCLPEKARAVVVFAHGSGSSRFSPRNRLVAGELEKAGLGTFLLDLLLPSEEDERFDIDLLARRLTEATAILRNELRVGYFGASTGAAAALKAAAEGKRRIEAIVSRGGRADLAGAALAQVKAPTLLIVGGADRQVISLNQKALEQMSCPRELVQVAGATHLFEEPGALERVAELAREWFLRYLPGEAN